MESQTETKSTFVTIRKLLILSGLLLGYEYSNVLISNKTLLVEGEERKVMYSYETDGR
jgi:hypothetical protein